MLHQSRLLKLGGTQEHDGKPAFAASTHALSLPVAPQPKRTPEVLSKSSPM